MSVDVFICRPTCSACATSAPLIRCMWPGCASRICRQCARPFEPARLSALVGSQVAAADGERFAFVCPPHALAARNRARAGR